MTLLPSGSLSGDSWLTQSPSWHLGPVLLEPGPQSIMQYLAPAREIFNTDKKETVTVVQS